MRAASRTDCVDRPCPLQDALQRTIGGQCGYVVWDVDRIGWRVDLLVPDRESFHAGNLKEALAWCLVWVMADELGVGPFA